VDLVGDAVEDDVEMEFVFEVVVERSPPDVGAEEDDEDELVCEILFVLRLRVGGTALT
jgi:hypothetical protein